MNHTPNETEAVNAWANRAELPSVSVKNQIITSIVCFVCALTVPLCGFETFSLISLAILFAYVALMARMPFAVTLTLVSAFAVVMLSGAFGVGAQLLSLVVGTVTCTLLLTTLKLPYLALLIPVAAAGASYVFVSDLKVCLLSLVFLPASLLLSFATVKGRTRTSAICFASGGLILSLCLILAFLIWREYGSLSREAIVSYVTEIREALVNGFISARDEVLREATENGSEQTKQIYEQFAEIFTDDAIENTVAQMFNMLPAVIVVICNAIAFEAQLLLNACYMTVGLRCVITRESRTFTMSLSAAVIYAVTFLLMIFLPQTSMAMAVVQNICLILLPGLCIVGITGFFPMLANSRGGMRIFWILLLVFLFCFNFGSAFYILAMFGAYAIVMTVIRLKMIEKLVKNGQDRNNRDDHDPDDRA